MKTAVADPNPAKTATAAARKKGRFSVREHGKTGAASPLRYDAEDVEEANRTGAALCRLHAR